MVRRVKLVVPVLLIFAWVAQAAACPAALDFSFRPLAANTPVKLCEHYAGKVVLVVNTASKCGFTYQYDAWKNSMRHTGRGG